MPSLLHISVTTGDVFGTGSIPGRDRTEDVRAALETANGDLVGTPWAVRVHAPTIEGGRIFDVAHDGAALARGWLCFEASAHAAMWNSGVLSHFGPGVRIEEPRVGPWLLTAQLPDGARITASNPALRLEARKLLREAAWAIMGQSPTAWDSSSGGSR
jgi:hypothetical protein